MRPRPIPALLALACVLTLGSPGVIAAGGTPATLPELVRSALATHESMASAESAMRRADADVGLARSALLPRLDLNGTYTRFQDELAFEFAPGQSFVIQPLADWNYSADLKQTLFYGLRDWRARDVAKVQLAAARLDRVTAAADLALQVSQSFFDAVAAAERLAVRHTALEQAKEQLRVARRRFEVGELTSADVARWRARVAAEEQQVAVADGAAELARRRLARLAGVSETGSLTPPPPIPEPPGAPRELARLALRDRPEMLALAQRLRAAGLLIRVEKGAWLPELEAHAQYYAQKSTFPSADWMSLSLTLKVPVYDGGVTAARVAKAREDLMDVEIFRRQVEKGIRDQVDAAAINYHTAVVALEAAEKQRAAAAEAHRQVERAYAVGEATATDLLSATTELTDAKTTAVIAHWQRELQAIALRHAVGAPPVPGVTLPGWSDVLESRPKSAEKPDSPPRSEP